MMIAKRLISLPNRTNNESLLYIDYITSYLVRNFLLTPTGTTESLYRGNVQIPEDVKRDLTEELNEVYRHLLGNGMLIHNPRFTIDLVNNRLLIEIPNVS